MTTQTLKPQTTKTYTIDYAALLATLAFTAPFSVNLAAQLGISRAPEMVTTLVGAVFLLGWLLVHEQVERSQQLGAQISALETRRSRAPHDPEGYFSAGEHLGNLSAQVGRPREAYAWLVRGTGQTAQRQRSAKKIASLRSELAEREGEDASI